MNTEKGILAERLDDFDTERRSDHETVDDLAEDDETVHESRRDLGDKVLLAKARGFEKEKVEGNNKNRPIGYEKLVDWQRECLEKINHERNVLLSSPTGSGKTAVFMEWAKYKQEEAEREGLKNYTTYITAPIKALSNQRFRELRKQGFKVGLETGDNKFVPKDAEFICCTQEIYTNRYADDENATLIVDELHYLFESQDRQRAYIDGLYESKAKNVLTCSATFGDVEKATGYLNKVSGRDFMAYDNHERLTTLEYGGKINQSDIKDALVVTFSARNCESIADDLVDLRSGEIDDGADEIAERCERVEKICEQHGVRYDSRYVYGVAPYYGAMRPKEKACIEELFEERLLDTVVGTDALALGVNFPVDKTVFAQLSKYYDGPISKNMFDQLAGRAGRKGYFDHGTAYYNDEFYGENGYPVEAADYETSELYNHLVEAKNESVNVALTPSVRVVLQGAKTIEEEIDYVVRGSTREIDADEREHLNNLLIEELDHVKRYKETIFREKLELTDEEKSYIDGYAYTDEVDEAEKEEILPEEFEKAGFVLDDIERVSFDFKGIPVKYYSVELQDSDAYKRSLLKVMKLFPENGEAETWCYSYMVPEEFKEVKDGLDSKNFKLFEELSENERVFAREAFFNAKMLLEPPEAELDERSDGWTLTYDGNSVFETSAWGNEYVASTDKTKLFLYELNSVEMDDGSLRYLPVSGTAAEFKLGEDGFLGRAMQWRYQIEFDSDSASWVVKDDYYNLGADNLEQATREVNEAWRQAQQENKEKELRRAEVLALHEQDIEQKEKEFEEGIKTIYDDRRGVGFNCELMRRLVDNNHPMEYLLSEMVRDEYDWRGMTEARAMIMGMPEKFRRLFDIVTLEDRINDLDETILGGMRDLLSTQEVKEGVME